MFLNFNKPFGLDISDYSIEAIALIGHSLSPVLSGMGNTLLKKGIFKNGSILNQQALAKAISNTIKSPKFGRFKTKKFIFSLPTSKSFIHILKLPEGLNKKEIPEFIKSQTKQTFPYFLEELYFDYKVQDGDVLLAAAPKNLIDDYLKVFKVCGLCPIALEIESISLGRALTMKQAKTVLVVDIGACLTNFSLFNNGHLKFSDSLSVGGNRFTQAIREKLNVSVEQARVLKKKNGFNPGVEKGRVFLILQKEIQPIIKEIKKINIYFKDKTGRGIEKIIVGGGTSSTPHLIDYLKDNVEISLALSDPWVKINIDMLKKGAYYKKALQINPVLYSTAIGSALRGLLKNPAKSNINLLP